MGDRGVRLNQTRPTKRHDETEELDLKTKRFIEIKTDEELTTLRVALFHYMSSMRKRIDDPEWTTTQEMYNHASKLYEELLDP